MISFTSPISEQEFEQFTKRLEMEIECHERSKKFVDLMHSLGGTPDMSPVTIPMNRAKLCLDLTCNAIWEHGNSCPLCAGKEYVFVANILNREERANKELGNLIDGIIEHLTE